MKVLLLLCLLLCGCQKASEKVEQSTQNVVETTKKSMDDLMNYFEKEKITFDDLEDVKETSFPYHDGKSFKIDDSYAYLYHLDTSDQSMKDLLQKAQHDGYLEISINDQMHQYQAHVNGDFLLLYDQKADAQEISDVFKRY